MTWHDTYEVEQPAMFAAPESRVEKPRLPSCGEMAPLGWIIICAHEFSPERSCHQVHGHAGPHRGEMSACNRPVAHEGDHMVTRLHPRDGYEVLGRWHQ